MKTIKVNTQEMLEKVLQLRERVFVHEQGVDIQLEHDAFDTLDNPLVDHFALVIKEDIVIGACRCLYLDPKNIRLGRLCIHPTLRHQGFGLKFLSFVESHYSRLKVENIFLHAQAHALPFYKQAGYEAFDEPFEEAGILHQNMRKRLYEHFYTKLADYYDDLFPFNEHKKQLLNEFSQDKESILDLGCATGSALQYLNTLNKQTCGIDLDHEMILQAQQKKVNAQLLDMREIDQLEDTFDGILCLGNTLVHLKDETEIDSLLRTIYKKLNSAGEVLIQIINYDRIYNQTMTSLPTLYNSNKTVSLTREYVLEQSLTFKTTLKIGRKPYQSSVSLYPLKPQQLIDIALQNNFTIVKQLGGYDGTPFNVEESQPFILWLRKDQRIGDTVPGVRS